MTEPLATPTPVQQAVPLATPVAAPVPVQQAAPPAPAPQPAPPDGYEPRARLVGLQQSLEAQVLRNRDLEAQATQQSTYQQTLEAQLRSIQEQLTQQATQLGTYQQGAAAAQQQNQFWTLLSRDYSDLVPLAESLRMVDDEAGQRAIFETARQRIGGAIQNQTSLNVAAAFRGATPGTVPSLLNAPRPQLPSYEETMEHVMDDNLARNNPDEWQRWYEIYQSHPQMNYESLGLGAFVDPTPNHYRTRADLIAQQAGQPPTTPPIPQTPLAPTVPIGSWAPSGPFYQEPGNG